MSNHFMTSVLIGLISLAAVRAISWDLGGRDQWDIGSIGANPGKIEQNFYGPKTASNESGIKDPGENIGESKELKAAENQFLSSLASKQEKPDVVVWPARPGSSNTGHVIIDNDSPGDPVIFLDPIDDIDQLAENKGRITELNLPHRPRGPRRFRRRWVPYLGENGECRCGPPDDRRDDRRQYGPHRDIGQIGNNKGKIKEYNVKRYFGPPGGPDDQEHDIGHIGINKGWITEHNRKYYGGPGPDSEQGDIGEIGINKGWITEYNRKFYGPNDDIGQIGINKGKIVEHNIQGDRRQRFRPPPRPEPRPEARPDEGPIGPDGQPCVC